LNYQFPGQLEFNPAELIKGGVGAMVPAANGGFLYAPLIGNPLAVAGKNSAAVNSVARAVELYLSGKNTNEVDDIKNATGFDVSTINGLRSFINQYFTYTRKFPDTATFEKGQERFMFSIDETMIKTADKTKHIKIGFASSGRKPVYANLTNGQLSEAFRDALQEGFQQRSAAVVYTNADLNIRGINSSKPITNAVYNSKTGKWVSKTFTSYNQYVKSFSKTAVYGRNKLSDGSYTYVANPQLPMDLGDLRKAAEHRTESNESPTEVKLPTVEDHIAGANALDDLMNMSPIFGRPVQEIGSAPEKSNPLSVQSLQEIYNFTPSGHRNGKTVLEVYKDLAARGHTFIPKGFNPFSRCL
jgi:hypothetical protein